MRSPTFSHLPSLCWLWQPESVSFSGNHARSPPAISSGQSSWRSRKTPPHFRSIAEKISALSSKSPSRQAVFQRLKQDSAVDFFFGAFQQVLREQTKRFIDPELEASLEKSEAVFNRIIIEDGSVIPLHGSLSAPFKGSSNQFGDTAALRLRWAFDFRSGETIDAELHHWRENDMSTTFDLLRHVRPGDLLLRDMGYFCLEALHEIHAAGAWFITRIPEGTVSVLKLTPWSRGG